MKNMNRVTLIGQLAADPEVKSLQTGNSVATLRVATNYSWKDPSGEWKRGVDYHKVVAWAKLAEQVAQSQKKGKRVYVEGKIRTRSYTDSRNEERYVTEIVAQTILPMVGAPKPGVEAEEAASDADEAAVMTETAEVSMEPVVVPV
jgi:single-strand DNA-binding protein